MNIEADALWHCGAGFFTQLVGAPRLGRTKYSSILLNRGVAPLRRMRMLQNAGLS